MNHLSYREDIDALRGVAVLLVVVYHAFPNLMPGGFIGVDIFFVISGFLITTIMLKSLNLNNFSLLEFYARRVRRIFPALITVLLFVLILGWLVLFPDEYRQLALHVVKSVIFVLNFTLINEVGYFDVESHYKPLLHLWSLSIEEQYYLLWPLILLLFLKYNKHPAYLFGFVLVLSFLINLYYTDSYRQEAYYHTLGRFWQLAAGSLLAVLLANKNSKPRLKIFYLGVLMIFVSAFGFSSKISYPGFWAVFPVLGSVLIISANYQLKTYFGLSKIGLISYPLYLWHWVLISFLFIYMGRRPDNVYMTGVIVLSLLLSFLTYRYIERLRYVKSSTIYLLITLVFVGVAGLFVMNNEGLPQRNHISYYMDSAVQFKRTSARDANCEELVSSVLKTEAIFDYCRSKNLDKNDLIAVIGDSHAHAVFPGVGNSAEKYDYGAVLFANSSCPPLVNFFWPNNVKNKEECHLKIEQILAILKKEKRIKKVLFLSRGPVYINGEIKGVFTEEKVEDSLKNVRRKELTYDAYFKGFQGVIEVIEGVSHIEKMFYMLENPELDFLPKETMPRPYDVFGVSTNRNYINKNLYKERMRVYRTGLATIHSTKLVYLDPKDIMCDKEKCFSFVDGVPLYADDDHFSIYGSEWLMRYFENKVFLNVMVDLRAK